MTLTLIDLLSKGYFPKELPPPFSTTLYGNALAGTNATPPSGFFHGGKGEYSSSHMCIHNLVRTGGLRRHLGIPNPVLYCRLAQHIVDNWTDLKKTANMSPYSLTKPLTNGKDRAISPENDLNGRTLERAQLRSRSRFIFITDISRFFPSIYTHVLPWALLGKSKAKEALNNSQSLFNNTWEDLTDKHLRNLNEKQTIGIPIGPDTSRLLAEVVLGRVDSELDTECGPLNGIRYIDDYEFGTTTRSEAENIASRLQHFLSTFELALNPSKTKITELPIPLEPLWTSKLRTFIFRYPNGAGQKNDLAAYFDLVFDLFVKYPEEGLLKYAIARLRSTEIQKDNLKFLEDILNQCILVEPACIPQVCDQILYYKNQGYQIQEDLWKVTLNRIVFEQLPLGHASEAAWAMWVMKVLGITLLSKNSKIVGDCEDSITGLMGLGLAASGLAQMSDLSALKRYEDEKELYGSQWLLCYEGNKNGWFGSQNQIKDPNFKYLSDKDVRFFDIDIAPPDPVRMDPTTGGGGGGGY